MRSSRTSTRSAEDGAGLIGSIVGVTVFLVLLLFAVQLALNLYATSAVSAVAWDAAREVAHDGDPARAEQRARAVLDRYEEGGGRLSFDWDVSRPDVVVLHVVAEREPLLANVRFPFQRVERTVTVRWERFR
jgi:hypothetical protein